MGEKVPSTFKFDFVFHSLFDTTILGSRIFFGKNIFRERELSFLFSRSFYFVGLKKCVRCEKCMVLFDFLDFIVFVPKLCGLFCGFLIFLDYSISSGFFFSVTQAGEYWIGKFLIYLFKLQFYFLTFYL